MCNECSMMRMERDNDRALCIRIAMVTVSKKKHPSRESVHQRFFKGMKYSAPALAKVNVGPRGRNESRRRPEFGYCAWHFYSAIVLGQHGGKSLWGGL
jgi:hypothetical protein